MDEGTGCELLPGFCGSIILSWGGGRSGKNLVYEGCLPEFELDGKEEKIVTTHGVSVRYRGVDNAEKFFIKLTFERLELSPAIG